MTFDALTIGLLSSTIVTAVGALLAVFQKNIRALNCFGRSCIQFRSNNNTPDRQSPSQDTGFRPAIQAPPTVAGQTFGTSTRTTQQSQTPTVNINIDDFHRIDDREIKITQL